MYVKKCQRNQEEVAVITRLNEVVDTMTELSAHLESAGIAGIQTLMKKTTDVIDATLSKYGGVQLQKLNVVLSMRNDTVRTNNATLHDGHTSAIFRRKNLNNIYIYSKLIINNRVVCTKTKRNILYHGF